MSHNALGAQFSLTLNQYKRNKRGEMVAWKEHHTVEGDTAALLSKAQEVMATSPDPIPFVTHSLIEGKAPAGYRQLDSIISPESVGHERPPQDEIDAYYHPPKKT